MKILIFSHHHAELVNGGAQRAAYTLFQKINEKTEHEAVLVAYVGSNQLGHDGSLGLYRGRTNEMLWASPGTDHFTQMSNNYEIMRRDMLKIVAATQPDVVHFHHYNAFGIDAFQVLKDECKLPIVLTLHEYMLICNHNGQMVKTGSYKLCNQSGYTECHACFPDITSGKFFLREKLIKSHLVKVDCIISPSNFLIDRYRAWGVEQPMHMIENLLPDSIVEAANEKRGEVETEGEKKRLRIGYFGQINPYKGATVLLDAIAILPKKVRKKVELVVFGDSLDIQSSEFRAEIQQKLDALKMSVTLFGSYNNEDVVRLMRTVDWCVIPSVWWENSPLVIQEAKVAGVPILGSNIGGIKEKIVVGKTGHLFAAGSAFDLSAKLDAIISGRLVVEPGCFPIAAANNELLGQHLDLYGRL